MTTKTSRDRDERSLYFQYLNDIAKYPLLQPAEERLLIKHAAQGNRKAMDRLVIGNLKFVVNIANLYKGQGLSVTELINEGNMGLMEAARRFDPAQKIKFISYAVWWIRQAITRAIAEKARLVRISAEKELILRRFNKFGGALKQVIGGQQVVDPDSLTGASRYNAKQIEGILTMGMRHSSLDAPVGEDGDSSVLELTPADGDSPDEAIQTRSQTEFLSGLLDRLPDQERQVISLYYGIGCEYEMNLLEIGRQIGLSKERVRQLKENALAHLRELREMRELQPAA